MDSNDDSFPERLVSVFVMPESARLPYTDLGFRCRQGLSARDCLTWTTILIVLHMFLSLAPYAEAAPPSLQRGADSTEDPLSLYLSGNPHAAIQLWRRSLTQVIEDEQILEVLWRARSLVEYCTIANDTECVLSINKAIFEHLNEHLSPHELPEENRELLLLHLGHIVSLAALAAHDTDWMRGVLEEGFIGGHENLIAAPILYIKRTFTAADMLLRLERFTEANFALDKGLTALASLQSARSAPYDYPVLLAQAIALLTNFGRINDAHGFISTSSHFVRAALPQSSIEYARFLLIESIIAFQTRYLDIAHASAVEALDRFGALDLPARNFAGERMDLSLIIAAICALKQNDSECVRDHLESAHVEKQYFDQSEGDEPPTYIETYLAVHEVLIRSTAGWVLSESDSWFVAAKRVVSAPADSGLDPQMQAAKLVAYAILRHAENETDFVSLARDGLSALFASEKWTRPEQVGSLLFPDFATRLVAARAAALLTMERVPDNEEISLVLQAIEFYTRTARFKDSDALAELAQATTPMDRATRHALSRTRSREADHRYRLLRQQIAEIFAEGTTETARPDLDFDVHHGLVGIARQRILLEQVTADVPQAKAIQYFPSAQDVLSAVDQGEVFLFVADSIGPTVISVCITPRGMSAVNYHIDKPQLVMDLRILRAAVTADHAPSVVLDIQFPVAAARRVYDALLGYRMSGPHRCIEPGDTVYFAQPDSLVGVPLEATLADEPTRDESGWLLGTAPWAFRENHFVYVQSARAFVAQRALQAHRVAGGTSVLTVGDPQLGGKTTEGEERLAALQRRAGFSGTPGRLESLAALPNTADEARFVFDVMKQRGRLLIGEAATERQFRSDFLGQYRYLHLATHGLIREEIAGLTEAALVFTPGSSHRLDDDGLLTASEIADLTLNAEVAVLSACNTAEFSHDFLSETQGLTTAFAIAGVPSTIVSLWPVETFSSEKLVTAFFEEVTDRETTSAIALSNARTRFLESAERIFQHPRFWASFVAFGNSLKPNATDYDESSQVRIFDGLGEARSVVPIPNSSDIAVFWGPYKEGGPVTSVSRLDDRLGSVWQHDQRPVGRSRMFRHGDGTLVSLGFEFRDNLPTPVVLTLDEETGHKIALRRLDHSGMPGHIVGSDILAPEQFLVMTGHALDPYGTHSPESAVTYVLHVFDTDLNQVSRKLLRYSSQSGMPLSSGVAVSGSLWAVFLSEPEDYTPHPMHIGPFGTIESCARPRDSKVFWLSSDDHLAYAQAEVPGIAIRSVIVTDDGEFVFLGSERVRCTFEERLVIGTLKPGTSEWQRVYTDASPFGSLPSHILEDASGDFVVASAITRNLDGNFLPSDDGFSLFDSDGLLSSRAKAPVEGRVLWVSREGVLLGERLLSAGVDVYIDGLSITADKVLLAGSIGSIPYVMKIPQLKNLVELNPARVEVGGNAGVSE